MKFHYSKSGGNIYQTKTCDVISVQLATVYYITCLNIFTVHYNITLNNILDILEWIVGQLVSSTQKLVAIGLIRDLE